MNNRDIMVRNLVCNLCGVDKDTLDASIRTGKEDAGLAKLEAILDKALVGPYGDVSPCDCAAWDGYQLAVEEIMALLDQHPTGDLTKEQEEIVRQDRKMLARKLADLAKQYDQQDEPEPEAEADPFESLFDLLKSLGFEPVARR